MLVDKGTLLHQIPQNGKPGMALGRNLELDARSLTYAVTLEKARRPIKPAEWLPKIPTLDQGNLGSCTGNAGTYALSALYGVAMLPPSPNRALSGPLDESFAVQVYHKATVADGFPGTYPPDDTGSSGLGVCRALKASGLIDSYAWALTARSMAVLLQTGGVMIGMPWYEAFFEPKGGFIDDNRKWQQSDIAGGHEVYVEALEMWSEKSLDYCVIRFHNSWSDSWGDHGCGRMRLSTYQALKSQMDCKQLRLSQPAGNLAWDLPEKR